MIKYQKMLSIALAACALSMIQPMQAQKKSKSLDPLTRHIDKSIRPQDDFFTYANGNWFKQHPIPASEQSNGIFQAIQDTVAQQVYDICKEAAQGQFAEGSDKQKIGDLYKSGMDSVMRDRDALSALIPMMRRIDNVKSAEDFAKAAAAVYQVSSAPFFHFYVGQDEMQSTRYVANVYQGGLSLPNRRYYVDADEKSEKIRQAFVQYATAMFGRMGYGKAHALRVAEELLKLETSMALKSRKSEDLRDPYNNYHMMSMRQFQDLFPHFPMEVFLKGLGAKPVDSVNVGQPDYVAGLDSVYQQYPLMAWKNYLKFRLVNGLAAYVDDATYDLYFGFYSTTLRGVQTSQPRWKRIVNVTNGALGELVGQVYVKEYLPKGTKEKLEEIGNTIREELAKRIENLDWMSRDTKVKALDKLRAIKMKVGYPDHWKDMSDLKIGHSFVENMMAVQRWELKDNLSKMGKPVDRSEWGMTPQTYNAYYNPSNNEICVPGCNIIVPGFKGMPDDAVLYAILGGSTFGHEMTHGFDDQGCLYDKNGNLNNWWTDADKANFDSRTQKIVKQFDKYEVEKGLHINGSLTQGENIADLGGVILGLQAFKHTKQFKSDKKIDGFTPLQRYFLGYAQAWMVQMRPEALANRVKSDVHSPAKWRVLGPLENIDEFYSAFNVKPGDKMFVPAEQRVKIW